MNTILVEENNETCCGNVRISSLEIEFDINPQQQGSSSSSQEIKTGNSTFYSQQKHLTLASRNIVEAS